MKGYLPFDKKFSRKKIVLKQNFPVMMIIIYIYIYFMCIFSVELKVSTQVYSFLDRVNSVGVPQVELSVKRVYNKLKE